MLLLVLACAIGPADPASKLDSSASDECDERVWYVDADGDGYGGTASDAACTPPDGYVATGDDCDDADPGVNPDAIEICDGVDQDCDSVADEDLPVGAVAADADGDGFGDPATVVTGCAPAGWVADTTDCDDTNAAVNPAAMEVCDDVDDDCDGLVDGADDSLSGVTAWYDDADLDGYGDPEAGHGICEAPPGAVADGTDCDDADPDIHPDAEEICLDQVDEDCDGYADDYGASCPPDDLDPGGVSCDASVPADSSLCTDGIAAVLDSGETYTTIGDAIDAAAARDTVTVCPGTWTENLVVTRSLNLVGYGSSTSIIDGGGVGPVVSVSAGALNVSDLGITGGEAPDGGGIIAQNAEVCVARSAFSNHHATDCGGGIAMIGTGGSLLIDDSEFSGSSADNCGASVYAIMGVLSISIDGSTFSGGSAGHGGALTADAGSQITIRDSIFEANHADSSAGAVEIGSILPGAGPGVLLFGVTFTTNAAGLDGGALALGSYDATVYTCVECVFTDNASRSGGAVDLGSWGDARFDVIASTFTDNVADDDGAAINVGGWGNTVVNVEASTLDGNSAQEGAGIAEGSQGVKTVLVIGSTITRNIADHGAGATVSPRGTLTSIVTDWGTGATDNTPDDVNGGSFGAAASFTCAGDVCR
jgi:hypothetical protein